MRYRRPKTPPCDEHPIGDLTLCDADRGGCPEEGMPFETERVILCRKCEHEVAGGTTGCLEFLLLKIQDLWKRGAT